MSVFVIADLHLSLATEKSMTVFNGWENYVERIQTNWNRIVSPEDTVVLPGDISWAMHITETYKDFEFIHRLPGQKIILKGNHDYWWTSMTKMNKYLAECGFDTIHLLHNNCYTAGKIAICGSRGWFFDDADKKILNREVGRIRTSIQAAVQTGLEPVLFLHYPPVTVDAVCDEILDVIQEFGIRRCYYGHIHKAGSYKVVNGSCRGVEFRCVSSDMVGFVPQLVRDY